jgi:hypothetical protein
MTALTLAINSLNDGGFSNVSTCGLMPTNSNCSLTDPLKYKRIIRFIYIFTITKVSMNHCNTQELKLWHETYNKSADVIGTFAKSVS